MEENTCFSIIYDEILAKFNEEFATKETLDNKASSLLAFSGIIAGIYGSIGAYVMENLKGNEYYPLWSSLFLISILIFVLSALFSMRAYQIRVWRVGAEVDKLYELRNLNKSKKRELLEELLTKYKEHANKNRKINTKKANWVRRAISTLTLGIIWIFLSTASAIAMTIAYPWSLILNYITIVFAICSMLYFLVKVVMFIMLKTGKRLEAFNEKQ